MIAVDSNDVGRGGMECFQHIGGEIGDVDATPLEGMDEGEECLSEICQFPDLVCEYDNLLF